MTNPVFRPGDRERLLRAIGLLAYPTGAIIVGLIAWGISRLV